MDLRVDLFAVTRWDMALDENTSSVGSDLRAGVLKEVDFGFVDVWNVKR